MCAQSETQRALRPGSMCQAGERARERERERERQTQEASWASNKTVVRLGLGNKRGEEKNTV